jgi:hypothetical protein
LEGRCKHSCCVGLAARLGWGILEAQLDHGFVCCKFCVCIILLCLLGCIDWFNQSLSFCVLVPAVECLPGFGGANCAECPSGTFSTGGVGAACSGCPTGSTTAGPGSTKCTGATHCRWHCQCWHCLLLERLLAGRK